MEKRWTKSNQNRSEKAQQELEEAFNILSMDGGPIEVNQVADYLDVKRTAIYNRVKKVESFVIEDGMIRKNNLIISKILLSLLSLLNDMTMTLFVLRRSGNDSE